MDAPPLQYVTTADGNRIAYCIAGNGRPLVMLPGPFNDVGAIWAVSAFRRPMLNWFVARFRLVCFDARGQGMSTRGLAADHTWASYLLDLDAVVDRLSLGRFPIVNTSYVHWRTAVRYAALHPEKVEALVLLNPDAPIEDGSQRRHPFEAMASQSWESFLLMAQSTYSSRESAAASARATTQADYLSMLRALMADDATPFLSRIACPTLIITERQAGVSGKNSLVDIGERLASAIPDARLAIFDGLGKAFEDEGSGTSPGIRLIDEFLANLADRGRNGRQPPPGAPIDGLSTRELEVLHLLAAGKSNQEIADELVISLNTVRRHVSNIFDKTGAANRAQAAVYAKDHGIA